MHELLTTNSTAITAACDRRGVKRLRAFGSVLTDQFEEARSDVDFLVEFREDLADLFDAYFGPKEDLESILGRSVDLTAPAALENPYFSKSVQENVQTLYAA